MSIPSRDEVVAWPVSFASLQKIHVIKMFAADNFREHAYPITEEVFWLWHGTWYPFGIKIDEKDITISPPDEFVAAVKGLSDSNSCEGETTPS